MTSASSTSGGTPDSTAGGGSGSNVRPKHKWPRRDLDWFASKIFETLETLRFLGVQGNHAARVSEKLLQGLCTSRMELKERYVHKRAEDQVQRERNSALVTLMNVRNGSEQGQQQQQGKEGAEDKLAASMRGHPVSSDRSTAGSASAGKKPARSASSGAERVSGSVASRSNTTSSNGHVDGQRLSNSDSSVSQPAPGVTPAAAAALDANNSTWTNASWHSIAQMAPISLSNQPHWLHANPSQQSAMPFGIMPMPANPAGAVADGNGNGGGGVSMGGPGAGSLFGPSTTFLDSLMMSAEEWAELTFGLDSSPDSATAHAARNVG